MTVHHLYNEDALQSKRSVSGWMFHEAPFVSAAHRPIYGRPVTLVDLLLNGAMQIGKGSAEGEDQLLQPRPVVRQTPVGGVVERIGRDHFIHNRQFALIKSVVKETMNGGLSGLHDLPFHQ